MNYYILLEDEKSFIKVLPTWLQHIGFLCTRVADIQDVNENNYVLQSGQGVTQLVTKALFDTIDTILCYPGKIDELVVILDAEELECESRKRQVLAKVNEKYMLGELPFHLEILVCNHCFETWLLGRKGLYPKELVPSESFFYPYYNHFDIENRDPEIMGVPVGVNETIGKYHFHYLHEVLRYKHIRRIDMTHNEKLVFLIEELLEESSQYKGMPIPPETGKQKRLLRTLMNIRTPEPISEEFLKVQDEYLSEEVQEKGIVDGKGLLPSPVDSRLVLWKGDITALKVDAIVNAANSALLGCFVPCHSCVDNIIHSVSGIQLRLACNSLMKEQGHEEPAGKAKITPAFNLPCKYVLHTVGPVVSGRLTETHCAQLAECYHSCLALASGQKLKSVAFCCISTGQFHFPHDRAAEVAVKSVQEFLDNDTQIERVIFNVYQEEDYEIYKKILEP